MSASLRNPSQVTLSRLADQMVARRDGVPSPDQPYRGFVEALDPVNGLRGWVAGASPDEPPAVQLVVDGHVLAEVLPTQARPDIWVNAGATHLAGFIFSAQALLAAAARAPVSPAEPLRVRIAGQALDLDAAQAWRMSELLAWDVAESGTGSDHETGIGLALQAELQRLAVLARQSFLHPTALEARKQAGMMEFVTALPGTGFVVGGWMKKTLPRTFAAVLLRDGQRDAGGFCCVTGPRPDLPEGFEGFVGLLMIEGAAEIAQAPMNWSLLITGRASQWLAGLKPLRIADLSTAVHELQRLMAGSLDARGPELLRCMRDSAPWQAAAGEASGIQVGIDAFLVLPGFGAFFQGWTLAPLGQLGDVACKLGDETLLQLDPSTLSVGARLDLATPFPEFADRLGCAAMAGVLRGPGMPDARGRWKLRLRFDSGAEHLQDIAQARSRMIDSSFDLARLHAVYPGFTSAPWLYEFAHALQRQHAGAGIHWVQRRPSRRALVVCVPSAARHQGVALEQLGRAIRSLPAEIGVVLVAPGTLPAGVGQAWLDDLAQGAPGRAFSMARLAPGLPPWPCLEQVLQETCAGRFAYVGSSVVLTTRAAGSIAEDLQRAAETRLTFFPVETWATGSPSIEHGSRMFAWDAAQFALDSARRPPLLPEEWRDNAMQATFTHRLAGSPGSACGHSLGQASGSALKERINQAILREHARRQDARTADPAGPGGSA